MVITLLLIYIAFIFLIIKIHVYTCVLWKNERSYPGSRHQRHRKERINRTNWKLITSVYRRPRFNAAMQFLCRPYFVLGPLHFSIFNASWINPFSFDTGSAMAFATKLPKRLNSLLQDWSQTFFIASVFLIRYCLLLS